MISIANDHFESLVSAAIDAIPELYFKHLKNVAFIVEAEPSPEKRQQLNLHAGQLLFGLYEGVPLPQRGGMTAGLLPDKITVYQNQIEQVCDTFEEVRDKVKETIWHEVAHYYGLDHRRIYELEAKEGPHKH